MTNERDEFLEWVRLTHSGFSQSGGKINLDEHRVRGLFAEVRDADVNVRQLRGNLSLAEEGLANATQEIAMLKGPGNATQAQMDAATKPLHAEIERLRAIIQRAAKAELTDVARVALGIERPTHEPGAFGYQDAFYQIAEVLDMSAMPISPKEAFETVMLPKLRALVEGASRAEPSESPQAPIAKIRVWAHLPPDVKLYAPGLPPGEHDVYCEPMSVAPALSASRDASSSVCTCGRQTDR